MTEAGQLRSCPPIANGLIHRPAVPALFALGMGICADRFLPLSMWFWLTAGCLLLALSILSQTTRLQWSRWRIPARVSSLLVLLTLACAGGANQHRMWNLRPPNDVSAFATEIPQLVRMRGIIASPIEMLPSRFGPRIPSWLEIDRSTCLLKCESILGKSSPVAVSGLLRMDVSGHLVHVRVGDRVEVLGSLISPLPPSNPGGMDYRNYLRAQGIGSLLRVNHPAGVFRIQQIRGIGWGLARLRESIRSQCLHIVTATLPFEQRGLAASLLIGDRTMLTEDIREQFVETGTMHLLAISGLHVGILLGLVLILCRLVRFHQLTTALILLGTVAVYVFITDLRPPILRAGLLATMAVAGSLLSRRVDQMNALAASGFILLLWNPSDLFDIGAQLSFLAVGAILWSLNWFPTELPEEKSLSRILDESSIWYSLRRTVWQYLTGVLTMTAAVMLATLPITMATFHLVTPIGLLLNLFLIPYSTIVLGLGYLLMFGALLVPISGWVLAPPFQWSLEIFQRSIEWGQSAYMGHLSVPDLPAWWIFPFYLLLAMAWQLIGTPRTAWWGARAALIWVIIGLLTPFFPARHDSFRCTFLSVGHGLATIIEFPTGEVLLYDAGNLGDGARATRAVSNALWSRGIRRIDAVIVSHADHDHFSGLFDLLEQFPVRTLFISRQFLDFQQRGVADLCELVTQRQISIQFLQTGDELRLKNRASDTTSMTIHSPAPVTSPRSDNANSIVMSLTHAGRRILLTGDLEKQGLDDLLTTPPQPFDVMLSPHHGGKVARIESLYDWARPRYAIVSSNERELPSLEKISRSTEVLNTAASGAIEVSIHSSGRLSISEYFRPEAVRHSFSQNPAK